MEIDFAENLGGAPTIEAGGPYPGSEGEAIAFMGSASGSLCGDYTIEWDFGDGTSDTGTLTPNHTYADNGTYNVTLTVTDDDGGSGIDTLIVTVNNVAPTVNAGEDLTVECCYDEVRFNGNFTDSGILDTHDIQWNFGDESQDVAGTLTPTHKFCSTGDYIVTLTVTDDDGGIGKDTLTVKVVDTTPPKISLSQADPSELWPPNNKFVTVTITGKASDICDKDLELSASVEIINAEGKDCDSNHDLVYKIMSKLSDFLAKSRMLQNSITKNQIVKISGELDFGFFTIVSIDTDGNIKIVVFLKAERSGKDDGRIYRITAEVTDNSGNSSIATADVIVPHDHRDQKESKDKKK